MKLTRKELGFLSLIALGAALTIGLSIFHGPEPQPAPRGEITAAAPEVAKFGYDPQPEKTAEFVASLPAPTLAEAGPNLFRAEKVDTFLYRSLNKQHIKRFGEPWKCRAQGIGDCVSWGWAHAADVHLAVLCELGESAEWKPAATEAIYGGSRVEARGGRLGGYSDGSYGGAAGKWVKDWGIVFRQTYDDIDLTEYSATRAKSWGNFGCGGKDDAGKLDTAAKSHPIKTVTLVRNFDELAAAILSGYPVPVCSGQGFASKRDAKGFARASGSWAHCMCFTGVRFDPPGALCQNSWGPSWISGPKYPDDQPDGSFWVDAATVTRMLSGGDSFAVSGFEGFPYRDLKHGDWVQVLPREIDHHESGATFALAP